MSVEALAAGLFPAGVAVAAWPLARPAPPLLPGEACGRAVPARAAEFAAGRAAARAALARLGLAAVAVPVGPGRAPVWPAGIVGSIAHGGGWALAAVAAGGDLAGLGLDIEADRPLPPEIAAEVCAPEELAGREGPARGRAALVAFCLREAFFKAQFPLTGRWLGFRDLAVTLLPGGAARLTLAVDAGPFAAGRSFAGRAAARAGVVAAGVVLSRRDAGG